MISFISLVDIYDIMSNFPLLLFQVARRLCEVANLNIGKYGSADLLPYYPLEEDDGDSSASRPALFESSGRQATFTRSAAEPCTVVLTACLSA